MKGTMMTGLSVRKAVVRGAGALAVTLLLATGCGDGDGENRATQGDSPAPANRSAAVIPIAGGQPSTPAPQFTAQVPSVPAGGVTLEDLHSQGKTDVVR